MFVLFIPAESTSDCSANEESETSISFVCISPSRVSSKESCGLCPCPRDRHAWNIIVPPAFKGFAMHRTAVGDSAVQKGPHNIPDLSQKWKSK